MKSDKQNKSKDEPTEPNSGPLSGMIERRPFNGTRGRKSLNKGPVSARSKNSNNGERFSLNMFMPPKFSSRSSGNGNVLVNDNLPEVGVATEMRLLSVDDAGETFVVMMLIHLHFINPDPDFMDPAAPDGFQRVDDYEGYIPEIDMVNTIETQYDEFFKTVRVNKANGMVWFALYNTCTITESLELENFPFDRQLFRVTFKSYNAKLRKWWINTDMLDFPKLMSKSEAKKQGNDDACFLVACELKHWKMVKFFVEYFPDDDDPASLTQGEFQITIQAERDPKFYFYNFYLVIYLIVLTNVCMISIEPLAAGERNAVTITLLLTLVAFKFVLNEGTPKVGYLTYMDKYVVLSFMFLMAATIENIIVAPLFLCALSADGDCDEGSLSELNEDSRQIDGIFQVIFGLLWTFVNLIVFAACYFPSLIRQKWEDVIHGQIGQTDDTLKRTNMISNGNETENRTFKTEQFNGVEYRVPRTKAERKMFDELNAPSTVNTNVI